MSRCLHHKGVDIRPRLPHNLFSMDEKTKKVLKIASGDLPITERPFDAWADKAGVKTGELLRILKDNLAGEASAKGKRGALRRFGAVLSNTKSGLAVNAMVAWKAPPDAADEAGEAMASFKEVSHCYLRETDRSWPYNLYTMIHAESKAALKNTVASISEKTGIRDFRVLETVRELKKTSPDYFDDEG
ncbi:MAG: Lrp/AsnC family transcriptional regulator [Deltaproteobacteria bacterium]|uniref:siroheme decarboxylase n=1 Tax=Candidatus Zymogenus saltonus TaxID=2844893 RepID=A0A9D8PPL2_9DELT|nr:Lrp/AsnC family transcriptional regulator [Candidatus Zymogenus saltonus]